MDGVAVDNKQIQGVDGKYISIDDIELPKTNVSFQEHNGS